MTLPLAMKTLPQARKTPPLVMKTLQQLVLPTVLSGISGCRRGSWCWRPSGGRWGACTQVNQKKRKKTWTPNECPPPPHGHHNQQVDLVVVHGLQGLVRSTPLPCWIRQRTRWWYGRYLLGANEGHRIGREMLSSAGCWPVRWRPSSWGEPCVVYWRIK